MRLMYFWLVIKKSNGLCEVETQSRNETNEKVDIMAVQV